ncbi:UNVERIFIED_CONTAM: ADP-ribosylation factor-like protein 4C [Gekko kuhli]
MGNISSNISAFQSLHIVMLGLDSAGKTTVLYRLKFNEFVNTVPTIGFNTEKIKLSNGSAKGISCHFWDVGGQEKLRPLWKSYSRCTDGIIYVVDSVDVDRLEEAKTELHKVTKFAENQGTPLLVIANKQDLPRSLPVADIEKQLALQELSPATAYHVQPACAIIGEGLTEGMDRLYEMILKRRKTLKQKKKRHQALTDGILLQSQVFNNMSSPGLAGAIMFHPGLCFLCQDYTLRKDRRHFLPY